MSKLESIDSLSSAAWQHDLNQKWNGDLLVLTPALLGRGNADEATSTELSFARLAGLLRYMCRHICNDACMLGPAAMAVLLEPAYGFHHRRSLYVQ